MESNYQPLTDYEIRAYLRRGSVEDMLNAAYRDGWNRCFSHGLDGVRALSQQLIDQEAELANLQGVEPCESRA